MIACPHWSDCGLPDAGCCALGRYGGQPQHRVCRFLCEVGRSSKPGHKEEDKETRGQGGAVFPVKARKKGCKDCGSDSAVFLPFFGEFGHLIASHVRMVDAHRAKRKIVFCEKGQECLFPSAAVFRYDWRNPVPDSRRIGAASGLGAGEHRRIAALFASGVEKVMPGHGGYRLVEQRKFWPTASCGIEPVDVAIAPRLRQHDAFRNYPQWNTISAALRLAGLRVGIVGKAESSAAIEADARAWEHSGGAAAGSVDLLARCRLLVSADSGVMHLAALMDVPSLIIGRPPPRNRGRFHEAARSHRGFIERFPDEVWADPGVAVRKILEWFEPTREAVSILSTGVKRRALLLQAATSVRRLMPRTGLVLHTDKPVPGYDCVAVPAAGDRPSRALKIGLLEFPPRDFNLLLDDDTAVLRQFGGIEAVLDDAQIALATDPFVPTIGGIRRHAGRWSTVKENDYTRAQFPDCGPHAHWNSGVIFFRRSPALTELARVWREEWERFRDVDQIALYRAVRRTGIAVKELPRVYHYRIGLGDRVKNPAIVHFTGNKWKSAEWLRRHRAATVRRTIRPKPPCRMLIVFKNGNNIGDAASAPDKYFPLAATPVPGGDDMDLDGDVIFGGGGIRRPRALEQRLRHASGLKIGWGIGLNDITKRGRETLIYPEWIKEFDLLGVRDWDCGPRWVPCVSCMSPALEAPPEPVHDVVFYKNIKSGDKRRVGELPFMDNGVESMAKAVAFLASARLVVTDSYHGAYWATLLGRAVLLIPISNKCFGFRHQPVITSFETWKEDAGRAVSYPGIMPLYRAANIAFHGEVEALLGGARSGSLLARYQAAFIAATAGVQTAMTQLHVVLLEIAGRKQPRRYGEIGSLYGRSAAAVAFVSAETVIRCFDMETKVFGGQPGSGKVLRETLERLAPGRHAIAMGDSRGLRAEIRGAGPYDLFVIDGDHTPEACWFDFETVLPAMNPGGTIVIDDLAMHPKLGRLFTRIIERHGDRFARTERRIGLSARDRDDGVKATGVGIIELR